MGDRYTLILRECADEAKAHVSQFLGKAFSLKESTCATIAESMPIALLDDLSPEEAAVLQLIMGGLTHPGVVIHCTSEPGDDLPKIDWPKRPPVFKRDLGEWVSDARVAVPLPGGNSALVLDLLMALLGKSGSSGTGTVNYNPQEAPVSEVGAVTGTRSAVGTAAREFKGSRLPEITPFSNIALPSSGSAPGQNSSARKPATPQAEGGDAMSRLNELFPDDGDAAFVPDKNDITSILNKLLPDEEGGGNQGNAAPDANNSGSSARLNALPATSGYSLFLAKIGDEGRREKAVPLIAELAKITKEEAEALSKKVIIPVLKGSTKDEAETAKQRFAKIGILARIKGAGEH
jgi:hypothetical protein